MSKWIKRFKYEHGDLYEANYQAMIRIVVSIAFFFFFNAQMEKLLSRKQVTIIVSKTGVTMAEELLETVVLMPRGG